MTFPANRRPPRAATTTTTRTRGSIRAIESPRARVPRGGRPSTPPVSPRHSRSPPFAFPSVHVKDELPDERTAHGFREFVIYFIGYEPTPRCSNRGSVGSRLYVLSAFPPSFSPVTSIAHIPSSASRLWRTSLMATTSAWSGPSACSCSTSALSSSGLPTSLCPWSRWQMARSVSVCTVS